MTEIVKLISTIGIASTLLTGCSANTQGEIVHVESNQTEVSIQLIGTATVLLEYGDVTIVTDPAFDPGGGRIPSVRKSNG